jgi:hypothetical protein
VPPAARTGVRKVDDWPAGPEAPRQDAVPSRSKKARGSKYLAAPNAMP